MSWLFSYNALQFHGKGTNVVGIFELCPGESIFFLGQGGTEEQHKLFLEILKETWQRVPAADRKIILDHYQTLYGCDPRVRLGAPVRYPAPLAMAGPDGFLFSCDVLHVFDVPGRRSGIALVIAEELAHAFLKATGHPTHTSYPPSNDLTSPEHRAWIKAMEDAMKEVLFRWPFDAAEHAKLIAWVESKAV